MFRSKLTALAAVLAICVGASAYAEWPHGGQNSFGGYVPNGYGSINYPALTARPNPGQPPIHQYPQLNTPLYPCPRQDIPVQVGGTQITNQAFAPHEMLYAHEYRGLYPPFYYRVKGSWLWTPFGVESHDKWELMGTEVKVKYRSNYSLLSGFTPRFNP